MAGLVKNRMEFSKKYLAGLAGQGGESDTHIFFLLAAHENNSRFAGYRGLRGRSINYP